MVLVDEEKGFTELLRIWVSIGYAPKLNLGVSQRVSWSGTLKSACGVFVPEPHCAGTGPRGATQAPKSHPASAGLQRVIDWAALMGPVECPAVHPVPARPETALGTNTSLNGGMPAEDRLIPPPQFVPRHHTALSAGAARDFGFSIIFLPASPPPPTQLQTPATTCYSPSTCDSTTTLHGASDVTATTRLRH